MKHQQGLLTAGFAEGGEHALDARNLVARAGVGIGHRPGRAHAGTGAGALTEVGIDVDQIAQRLDGTGRTGVEAARTAAQAGIAVGADVSVVGEKARLLELAGHVRHFGQHAVQPLGIATRRVVAERRDLVADGRLAAQVEHQIKPRLVRARQAGGRDVLPVGELDRTGELAQVTGDLARLAAHDHHARFVGLGCSRGFGQGTARCRSRQHRAVQVFAQGIGTFKRIALGANNQHVAGRPIRHQ